MPVPLLPGGSRGEKLESRFIDLGRGSRAQVYLPSVPLLPGASGADVMAMGHPWGMGGT